jgi:cobalamin biosynthesis protein CobT
MDDSTAAANSPAYLSDHLRAVAAEIDASGDIVLGALGLEHPVSQFYSRVREATTMDELSAALFALLEEIVTAASSDTR